MDQFPGKAPHFITSDHHFHRDMPVALRIRDYSEKSDLLHSHEFHELVLVLGGSGLHVLQERSYPIYPGDVFLIKPRQVHGNRNLKKLNIANFLYLPDRLAAELDQRKSLLGYYVFFESDPLLAGRARYKNRLTLEAERFNQARELTLRMRREQQRQTPGWELMSRLLFLQLMLLICRTFSKSETTGSEETMKIGRILRYFEENYARPVALAEVARHCGCSVPTLTRFFREAMDDSPIDYLNRLRLDKAAELLRSSRLPVTEIARKTGFCDSNYLTKCFTRRFALSPRAYRKMNSERRVQVS